MTDSRWLDPEIDGILDDDPELTQLAHLVRAARPEPSLDTRFQAVLRAQLMREAAVGTPAASQRNQRAPRQRVVRRVWWRRPSHFAWGGAGLGIALAAAAVISIMRPIQDHQVVTAGSPVAELHQVSPDHVITVAFSQPMNHQAVVAGLHIRPATEVSTAWQGNNLLITPTHRLAGNTPYTVTIDRSAAQAANGAVAATDIHISFGTAPTPPPAPAVVSLTVTALGTVDAGSQLIAGPAGSVIATSSSAAPTTPTPPTSPTPSATASPSGSPSAAGAAPLKVSRTVLFGPGGTTDLGPASSSTALSANGLRLVSAVSSGSGSQVVLSTVNGGKNTVLTTLGVPVLATGWLSPDTAVVAESDRILTIDLQGHVSNLMALPAGTTTVMFAPVGGHAYAGGAGGDGALFDLATKHSRVLAGSRTLAAFSGDGGTVAWIDSSQPIAQLMTAPVAHDQATIIPLDHPGDGVAEIALDQTGARAAIIDHPAAGGDQLDINALPSGTVVARGPSGTHPVFTSSGNSIALVAPSGQAEAAILPGPPTPGTTTTLPNGAAGVLQAFVDAQTSGDAAAISALTVPSLAAAQVTPHGLTRAYVISAAVNQNGTISATARLIIDASVAHPLASFADESLTLTPGPGKQAFQVSAIAVSPLHDEPVGPHVVHLTPTNVGGVLVLQVAFDSDLRQATVGPAISVTTGDGQVLPATTVYDAERRTAVVTLTVPANTPVSLTVNSGLLDVDGQALASAFTTAVGG
ncbi:MAG: Ig-like domain-containing protein [Candidatus Dormibacteria bacterium]